MFDYNIYKSNQQGQRKYTIGTGYWSEPSWINMQAPNPILESWMQAGSDYKSEFFQVWWENTMKYANPYEVVVIDSASPTLPKHRHGHWISLKENLGHVHDLDLHQTPLQLGAWSVSFVLGALFAYNNRSDFIVKGQSCLAFGPWVEELYQVLEKNNLLMLMGTTTENSYGIEQSLFIIKHAFILPFLTFYLDIPNPDGGHDDKIQPENKFLGIALKSNLNSVIGKIPFGFGKVRPIDFSEPIFYMQRVSPQELKDLKVRGLV